LNKTKVSAAHTTPFRLEVFLTKGGYFSLRESFFCSLIVVYLFDIETPNNIEMKLYRLCDELKIPRRSPNKLRMTYVSTLLNQNIDPDFVRQQAGHTTLQTTLNHYAYSTTRQDQLTHQLNAILN